MSFRLKKNEPVDQGIRRVAAELGDRAIAALNGGRRSTAEGVHRARVAGKKIRAILRLVRGNLDGYSRENAWYRDAARHLAARRDGDAMRETVGYLEDRCKGKRKAAVVWIRGALPLQVEPSAHGYATGTRKLALAAFAEGRQRIDQWKITGNGFEVVRAGLERVYRRGSEHLAQARSANEDAEALHEWRKQVKYLGYQLRFLQGLWPSSINAVAGDLRKLAERLGWNHNLHILATQLRQPDSAKSSGKTLDRAIKVIEEQRRRLRIKSLRLGQRIFAETPESFIQRMEICWKVWRDA